MSKKSRNNVENLFSASPAKGPGRSKKRPMAVVVVLALCLCLGILGITGSGGFSKGTAGLRSSLAPALVAPNFSATSPSKEYIYAGSKLIATEEPVIMAPPLGLTATTISEPPAPQVNISWSPSPGADHYEIEKTTKISLNYVPVNLNVSGTTFTDSAVSSVTAYLYRVRAVNSAGGVSPYSNVDLATAISFTDNSLVIGSTPMRATHITQLREAINAVRAVTANLGPVSWAESIGPGVPIKASHIQELRTKLDEARGALGLSSCTYTNASTGQLIQKVHIDQLRQCVR